MSTATAKYVGAKPQPKEPMVALVSKLSRLYLDHNEDETTRTGALRTVRQGRCIKFKNNHAVVPESWVPDVLASSFYGTKVWVEGDPSANGLHDHSVQVRDGAMSTASRLPAGEQPPTPDWDEMSAQKIKPLVLAQAVDLRAALAWEFDHRNRASVIKIISEARSLAGDDFEELEESEQPETIITTVDDES